MSLSRIFIALCGLSLLVSPRPASHVLKTLPAAAVNGCAVCDGRTPEEGALSSKLRLGKPVEFDDGVGINDGRCFPLYAGDKLLTWLYRYHQVGAQTYVLRCVENSSLAASTPASMGGYVASAYVELIWPREGGAATFNKLDLPLWSEYSNPAFCNSHVAYWGTEPGDEGQVKIYGILLDLNSKEVVKKEFLGTLKIESDSRSFFAAPKWEGDGQMVLFDNAAGKEIIADGDTKLRRVILSVK